MNTKELKTNIWNETKKTKLQYDEVLDAATICFTEKETERLITHFVDDNVALLYRNADKEIVGIRIEYFKEEFLPKIEITNGWRLSDTGEKLDGIEEFNFKAIELKKVYTNPLTPTIQSLTIPNLKQKLRLEKVPL